MGPLQRRGAVAGAEAGVQAARSKGKALKKMDWGHAKEALPMATPQQLSSKWARLVEDARKGGVLTYERQQRILAVHGAANPS